MLALQIVGPYLDRGHAGDRVRALARTLLAMGQELRLLRLPLGPLSAEAPHDLKAHDGLGRADVVLHICPPEQVNTALSPDAKHVNLTFGRPTEHALQRAMKLPLTIVPSACSMRPGPVAIIPYGVDRARFHPAVRPTPIADATGQPIDRFKRRYLVVASTLERKNLAQLLQWWPSDESVLILLLSQLQRERMQVLFANQPKNVVVIPNELSSEQLPGIFAAATTYVSASHFEGWDDALVQAAAVGLGIIAPNHSVYADLLPPAALTWGPDAFSTDGARVQLDFTWEAAARDILKAIGS